MSLYLDLQGLTRFRDKLKENVLYLDLNRTLTRVIKHDPVEDPETQEISTETIQVISTKEQINNLYNLYGYNLYVLNSDGRMLLSSHTDEVSVFSGNSLDVTTVYNLVLEITHVSSGNFDEITLSKVDVPSSLPSDYTPSTLSNNNLVLSPGNTYNLAFSKLEKAVTDNDEVTAAALVDLETRKANISDVENLKVTYDELVLLRNNYKLIPGKFYRIIDYQTVTSQINTRSAGHQFDIIVQALDTNILSENAKATYHVKNNSDYFYEAGAKVESWELKYCLDNDINRFAWSANAFPTLYKTNISLYADEVDYLDYYVYTGETFNYEGTDYYLWEKYENDGDIHAYILTDTLDYSKASLQNPMNYIFTLTLDKEYYDESYSRVSKDKIVEEMSGGKGVIYYMKDEWNNECPYDFKNILFKRWAITNITSTTLSSEILLNLNNTFNFNNNGGIHFANKDISGIWLPNLSELTVTVDETEFGWYYTFNGMSSEDGLTISNRYDLSTKQFKLSDECLKWLKENNSGTTTQDNCYNNKISLNTSEFCIDDVYNEGRYVLNNIVFNNSLSYCYYNEDYWKYSVCNCYNNIFGTDCYSNTFGDGCNSNVFGDNCNSNVSGNGYGRNIFRTNCHNNIFGDSCSRNIFGTDCHHNTFGNDCCYNTFGNNCNSNTFGNDCDSNIFGNSCYNNTFGNYTSYNIIETNNKNIVLSSSQVTTPMNNLKNIKISQGFNNSNNTKTITHTTLNDNFQTIYKSTNSQVITL